MDQRRYNCPYCGVLQAADVDVRGHCRLCGATVGLMGPPGSGRNRLDDPTERVRGRRALAAIHCAVAGLLVPLLGLLPAIAAVVLGAHGRLSRRYRGWAVAGLVLGLVAVVGQVGLIFLVGRAMDDLLYSVSPHRDAVCSSNLRGLGLAIAMYSEENRSQSPHIKPTDSQWGATWAAPARNVQSIDALAAQANDEGANIQHWWLLVHSGQVSTGQFKCPAAGATDASYSGGRFGFSSWRNVSYALPIQSRHEENLSYVGAAGQSGAVVWAADVTAGLTGGRGNHRDGINYLSANYSVRFHRGTDYFLGFEEDDIFTQKPGLGANDSYLIWTLQD